MRASCSLGASYAGSRNLSSLRHRRRAGDLDYCEKPTGDQVSYRRYRLILGAVLRDGRWAGTVRGGRVKLEREIANEQIIHWSSRRGDEWRSGTARQVKEALNACA